MFLAPPAILDPMLRQQEAEEEAVGEAEKLSANERAGSLGLLLSASPPDWLKGDNMISASASSWLPPDPDPMPLIGL